MQKIMINNMIFRLNENINEHHRDEAILESENISECNSWNEWRDFMVVQGPTKRRSNDYKFPRDVLKGISHISILHKRNE